MGGIDALRAFVFAITSLVAGTRDLVLCVVDSSFATQLKPTLNSKQTALWMTRNHGRML